jgi:S-adenosylmethionine synthetase
MSNPDKSEDIYERLAAAYGYFGRKEFMWERVDATQELLAGAKKI